MFKALYHLTLIVATCTAVRNGTGLGHSCDVNRTLTVRFFSACSSCFGDFSCPPGARMGLVRQCSYRVKGNRLIGCQMACNKSVQYVVKRCCDGYWGANCDECPGGAGSPCNNHGNCSDTKSGNGHCVCDDGFTGFACESCINDFYGQDCKNKCLCENGTCSSGVHGNGSCDCWSGYTGRFCNHTIAGCAGVRCHGNARCVEGLNASQCICSPGYHGDGINCLPLDPCSTQRRRICHPHATCKTIAPTRFTCECSQGYQGDGRSCQPIDPCQSDNGGCPRNSTTCVYTGPAQNECRCLPYFENYTDGRGCQMIDMCINGTTQCHKMAECRTTAPGKASCLCKDGYIGTLDGRSCYGNIIQSVADICEEDSVLKGRLGISMGLMKLFSESLSFRGPLTLFLPTDTAFRRRLKRNDLQKLMKNKEWGWQLLKQHIIAGQFALKTLKKENDLFTLQGIPIQIIIKYYTTGDVITFRMQGSTSKARMVKEDIIASNGIVHVIDAVFDRPPVVKGNTKKTALDVVRGDGRYNRFENLLWVCILRVSVAVVIRMFIFTKFKVNELGR